ncbi:MAG: flagellar motor protein MotB [Sphingobium sp.]|nr:flagellar motor protein MotB [Sphingobium sp.]
MRKLAVSLALASTIIATPALARDKSWYVGVDGGATIVERINYDIGAARNAASASHDYGFDVSGNIGYDFGVFRVEAEVAYKRANVRDYSSSTRTAAFGGNGTLFTVAPGTYGGVGGNTSALSFMVNGLVDFGDDDDIQGFVGGGVGVARVKASRYAISQPGGFLDDSDTRFAYQAIAGVRAPLSKHIDVSVKYRFFTAPNARFVDVQGRNFGGTYRSHSLLGGITYNFGGPEAPPPAEPAPPPPPPPPPPPAEPAPPPPPPAAVCQPGPFIVFFDFNKSDITTEAASILDNAIAAYGNCGQAQVMLAGFTDRSGTPKYNIGLSQRRADAVKAYFSSHSIPEGVITTSAFGEDPTKLRVQTADGVREVQNRRVEITYGPGSGN